MDTLVYTLHMEKYEIITFKNDLVQIDVNVSPNEETVWLTLNQISELFGRDKSVISRHINKIFEEEELVEEQVVAKNAMTGPDGKIYNYDIYNLDVIISVGYRVKSKNGIVFRKWANNVLKEFLLKGYCVSNRALVSKDNYLTLCNKVLSLDEEVNKLKKEIAKIKPKSEIFYKGQYFESQIFISKIVEEVDNELIIIDPYFDVKALDNFKVNRKIKCKLITSSKSSISDTFINSFSNEYFPILKKYSDVFHDRFLILDSKIVYHIGTSFNYLGKHIFVITKIEDAYWQEEFLKIVNEI